MRQHNPFSKQSHDDLFTEGHIRSSFPFALVTLPFASELIAACAALGSRVMLPPCRTCSSSCC